MSKPEKLIEVYRAANDMEVQVIRSLLESYDIACVLKPNAPPSVLMGVFDTSSVVKVMCLAPAADKAREILDQKNVVQDDEGN